MEIDSSYYLNALQYQAALQAANTSSQSGTTTDRTSYTNTSDKIDNFSSSVTETGALRSETYNDIMELIKANKQAAGTEEGSAPTQQDFENVLQQILDELETLNSASSNSSDSTATNSSSSTNSSTTTSTSTDATSSTTTGSTDAASSTSSASGSSDSSDSDDTTVTETITMPDGSVFLKTTTTAENGTQSITMQKVSDGNPMDRMMMPPMPPMDMPAFNPEAESAESTTDSTSAADSTGSTTVSSTSSDSTTETTANAESNPFYNINNESMNFMRAMNFNGMMPPMMPQMMPFDETQMNSDNTTSAENAASTVQEV